MDPKPIDTTIEIEAINTDQSKHPDILPLVKAILFSQLESLQNKSKKALKEFNDRHGQVIELHHLMQALRSLKDNQGNVDITQNEEIKNLIKRAKELGVDLQEDKTQYTKEELNDLLENIRMTVEDLNTKNEVLQQKITRLNNEKYESLQIANKVITTLKEIISKIIQGINNR